ncbi:MAG: phosphoribosylformylglycinamidine cyclo-ligase [Phycisphaerae bacterium]|nr:phosphoribosylformylglycinamidine cyclo-ligase [Phycisphaerae bacterium]
MADKKEAVTYKNSGVDINANDEMVDLIGDNVRRTHGPRVMHMHNAFAGLFRLDYDEKLFKKNYKNPVLIACTDGVGTKVKIAAMMKKYDTVGIDLVAMSVNDMIVQGAEPLFFLDYVAVNHLEPGQVNEFVKGVADGCVLADCALLGGETAEMPDVYRQGDFDLAGFAVGVAEKHKLVDGMHVEAGDLVIGLASSGIHSNGYSLVRDICFTREGLKVEDHIEELGQSLGEALLEPTRIYVKAIVALLQKYKVKKVVKAMAHITGGGLVGNIPRVIGDELDVELDASKWEVPAIFDYLQKLGPVETDEMYRVFNMGIGYVLIVSASFANSIMEHLTKSGEKPFLIGEVKAGTGKVTIK